MGKSWWKLPFRWRIVAKLIYRWSTTQLQLKIWKLFLLICIGKGSKELNACILKYKYFYGKAERNLLVLPIACHTQSQSLLLVQLYLYLSKQKMHDHSSAVHFFSVEKMNYVCIYCILLDNSNKTRNFKTPVLWK